MNSIILLIVIAILCSVKSQENAQRKVSSGLLECYNDTFIVIKDNLLPHNIHSFIGILRKIENNPELNMDLPQLTVSLLHRFRQDGIVENPSSKNIPGVTPYASDQLQSSKGAEILRLVPGNAVTFPNNSMSLIERCSLHSMVSSSIEFKNRGDESSTCRLQSGQYRRIRSLSNQQQSVPIKSDVEMLSVDELKTMEKNNNKNHKKNNNHNNNNNKNESKSNFGPNTFYSPLPPNHPAYAQLRQHQSLSKCPLESGVISTDWGTITGGTLLGGIAAGLQFQNVRISDLITKNEELNEFYSNITIDNKWFATLAGDLAELAILQSPEKDVLEVGINGHWNASILSKYYFLDDNDNTEFTAAEIRGDLDGLILASYIESWYKQVPTLRLSQIFDMYYSQKGVFNSSIRACNRRVLLTSVAPNETTHAQTYAASILLEQSLAKVSITDPDTLNKFTVKAINKLFNFIPSSFNDDKACDYRNDKNAVFNHLTTDLTIFMDTTWSFFSSQSILTVLLENAEINKFASNFTLLNAFNGDTIINNSDSILNFYNLTDRTYSTHKKGIDLPKIMDIIITRKTEKLNKEWEFKVGGGKSDIVLIISPSTFADADKIYCLERLKKIREDIPDVYIFFLVSGSKEKWSELALDPNNDIVIIPSTGNIKANDASILNLVNKMKQIPRRLVNSQCGANFTSSGTSEPYTNYIEPSGINFYRLHPNYFFKTDNEAVPTVKIQTSNNLPITVCTSRNYLGINSTTSSCTTSATHSVQATCSDASFIHQCSPLYLSIATNSSTASTLNQCPDPDQCRYPDMIKYTISYENLVCVNAASTRVISLISITFVVIFINQRLSINNY